MDVQQFTDRLGVGLTVTVGGEERHVIAVDATSTHVLLAAWSPPPGDGSASAPEWVDAATIDAVTPYVVPDGVTSAATPDPGAAVTYPDAPQETTP